jgi:hypothetical protein
MIQKSSAHLGDPSFLFAFAILTPPFENIIADIGEKNNYLLLL